MSAARLPWTPFRISRLACAAFAVATTIGMAQAQQGAIPPGEVVEAIPQARLSRDGDVSVLRVGEEVFVGDIVATGRTGEAQVVFPDDTRIVVGPNSQLKVDNAVFRNSSTYRRLSVSALKGTFRFLSGNSPSRAYSVRTPNATMGVRGTEFDFSVAGTDATDLVVYNGEVEICGRRARCVRVPGGCNAVRIDRYAGFQQPSTFGERRTLLEQLFPYAGRQDGLRPQFRVSNALCDDDDADPNTPIRTSAPVQQRIILPPPPSASGTFRSTGGGATLDVTPRRAPQTESAPAPAPAPPAPTPPAPTPAPPAPTPPAPPAPPPVSPIL